MSAFSFTVSATDGAARLGECQTAHGVVQTPAFMPVGTQGAVKAIRYLDLEEVGAEIILANTYHLLLRPGDELIARRGGLHRFIGWMRPIVTDSGGFQVFSLAQRVLTTEDGANFRSHLDGSCQLLTPERTTDIQARLGSDIAMVLDECLAFPATREAAAASMARGINATGPARRGAPSAVTVGAAHKRMTSSADATDAERSSTIAAAAARLPIGKPDARPRSADDGRQEEDDSLAFPRVANASGPPVGGSQTR